MSDHSKLPWYRRPLPGWVPVWLVLSLAVAGALGYIAARTWGVSLASVAGGSGVGFFVGLVLCMAVASRTRGEDAARFRPPEWLARPVSVAVLVLLAYFLIDESLRQGYFDFHRSYRRPRGYFRVPGAAAILIGCCFLMVAACFCVAWLRERPRSTSPFVGGVLGGVVLGIGLAVILARLWGHLA